MTNERTMQLIRDAHEKNLTELDLSINQLTQLPVEIGKLQNLTMLTLSRNKLTQLPSEIGELKNLTILYITDNKLTQLPPEIGKLKNLTKLFLSGNQLTQLPSEIGELQNLTILYITDNQLTQLPPEIGKLQNLTTLSLSRNKLIQLPSEIGELKKLIDFDLTGNLLTQLPPEIGKLKNITTFDLSRNKLTQLPSEIGELKILIDFDLTGNQLTQLPLEIGKLQNLTKLNLDHNQLTQLSPEINELKNLTEINLNHNHLTQFPSELNKLKNFTKLSMHYNKLTQLSPKIGELKSLTTLDLSYNQLSKLPPEITELKNITELNLSRNKFTELPLEIIQLKNITELNLSINLLAQLPPEIGRLKNLTKLYLSENKLTQLPLEIGELKNLIDFDLTGNQLTQLPSEITEIVNLKRLELSENPLTFPPIEIASKGINEIFTYLEEFKATKDHFKSLEGEQKPLNEVKVLLVGHGGAGKTSLVKRLVGEDFDGNEPQTHGIIIRKWVIENGERVIKANFWDFGGQDILHATHQFFFSKRSLYILVLDGRKDENPEYWLKLIENFGGDSPVIVILNKIDENPAFEVNKKFLRHKYPFIADKGFYRLSCKSDEGVKEFSQALREELTKIKHLEIKWSKSWFNVKSKLEELCNSSQLIEGCNGYKQINFCEYKKFKKICEEEGIISEPEQDILVDFLHDLGVIVHFRDIHLLNTHVLKPEWVTNGVYKIIRSEIVVESKGVLKLDMLPEILKQCTEKDYNYPPDQYGFFLSLMMKFELCYELDESTMLLPGLLEIQEPNFEFDYEGTLKFVIDYDFLPFSVMPRFIVKMNKDIKNNLCWRTGVVLENKSFNSSAVVRADYEAKKIKIYVKGEQRRDYFAVILQKFREINISFIKLKATERIPLPDNPKVTVSYKHLIKLEMKGDEMYMPEGSDYDYRVSDLLGTVINRSSERMLLEEILQITEMNKSSEKEILEIFKTLQKTETQFDTEKTLFEKIHKILVVRPSILGVAVDVNEIVRMYMRWKKRQHKQNS